MGKGRGPRAGTVQWQKHVKDTLAQAGVVLDRQGFYKIVNQAATVAEVYIYDEIGMWGQSASDFIAELSQVSAGSIDLHLNSPGGEVFDGIAIYNALKSHPANVTVYVDSLAASIASVIAQAGDHIVMRQGAQMMIHDAAGLCFGNADDMRGMADLLDRQSDNIAGFYAGRAGGTAKQWRTKMAAETWYTAEEAVAAGLADEAVKATKQPTDSMPHNNWDLSMFRYAGRDTAPAPVAAQVPAPPEPAEPELPVAPSPTGLAFPGSRPANTAPAADTAPADADEPVWDEDLAAAFTEAFRVEQDDEVVAALREAGLVPPPPDTEPEVLIDPIEFLNAVREGTNA